MDSIKEKFQKKIESINKEIDQIKRIDSLNSKLQKHNWILFHPYNQGFEIGVLERLVEKENNEQLEEKIFEIFARKFLNLGYTISITEGFYKKRPFIKDYSTQIDESIVSCLQKDFSGAIHL
ncbi:MAG: hypothetical protein KDD31_03105, partial [Muricauda sp.]|nr:hypothetical protein [Allomuricauda sp.]